MSTFWIAAGSLTLLVIAALAVPLLGRKRARSGVAPDAANVALYRDQLAELERDSAQGVLSEEQLEQAKTELGRRLLSDLPAEGVDHAAPYAPAGAWRFVALAAIPIVAVLVYLVLGVPEALEGKPAAQEAAGPGGHSQTLAVLVERLAKRLQENPNDAEAWVLYARSKQMLGQPAEALNALEKALALEPNVAALWADYADVLATVANGEWTVAAKDALAKALALDPRHPKSLWLAGSEAYARKDYGKALEYWETLAPLTEPGSEVARTIQANIVEVRTLIGGENLAASSPQPKEADGGAPAAVAAAKDQGVKGTVALDRALATRVQPGDTVFVFARAAQGPKIPLAIRRITVKDLPYSFALDDAAAMAPGMVISAFDQVIVGARVSRSGEATPKPGDFEGFSAPVKPGTAGIQVTINAEVR